MLRPSRPFPSAIRTLVPVLLVCTPSTALAQAAEESTAERVLEFRNAAGTIHVSLTEKLLGYEDPEMTTQTLVFSPDQTSMAYAIMGSGALSVVCDGETGQPFEGVSEESIRWSPNGRHLSYAAVHEDVKYVVVGKKLYAHENLHEQGVVFSPDGERFGWIAMDAPNEMLVSIDGEKQKSYDGIDPDRGVTFSADSAHFGYVASIDGKQRMVVDGEEGPLFDDVLDFWWSPTGARLAYVGMSEGKAHVVVDGETVAIADTIGRDGVVFAKSGARYAVAVKRGEVWSALVDGELVGEYKNLLPGMLFSDDGSRLAYIAGRGAGMFTVLDGVESEVQPGLDSFVFAPGGKRTAVVVREDGRRRVLIDGEKELLVDEVDPPGILFSDDGAHYFYRARNGEKRFVVLDGEPGPEFDRFGTVRPGFTAAGELVYSGRSKGGETLFVDGEPEATYRRLRHLALSPDGTRRVYFGLEGELWTLVVDGEARGKFGQVPEPAVFSDDGASFAFVTSENGKGRVVVDGVRRKAYDFIPPTSVVFAPGSHHVCHVAATSNRRWLVVDDLEIDNEYETFLNEPVFTLDGKVYFRAGRRAVFYLIGLEVS